MYFSTEYILLLVPFLLLSMWASHNVNGVFKKYLEVNNQKGITGYQAAKTMIERNFLGVNIELTEGHMTDHYDPRSKTVRLSNEVYYGTSVTSLAVACHEVGHAIQHEHEYSFLSFRTALFPVVSIASNTWSFLFLFAILSSMKFLITASIIMFSFVVLFQIITLPVEFDASKRALAQMQEQGLVMDSDLKGSKKVLRAAALTYVAAALMSIATLVRLILIRNRND